jgi:hypothetical protein
MSTYSILFIRPIVLNTLIKRGKSGVMQPVITSALQRKTTVQF